MKVSFPSGFVWGTAISAFQTEYGSQEEDGAPDTDWLKWASSADIRDEGLISGDSPLDGDGFWKLYEEDLKRAKELGTNSIRLSIEWTRIFPKSTVGVQATVLRAERGEIIGMEIEREAWQALTMLADRTAVEHYRQIFSYAKSLGLSIFLTLYHWPLPSWLHDPIEYHRNPGNSNRRGWLDEKTIIEFGKYAYFASKMFADLVDLWETINEPEVIGAQGYFYGDTSGFPPGVSDMGQAFNVERNLALAHNVAYAMIKKNTGNPVGIGISPPHFEPADTSPESRKITDRARYLNNEWILNAAVLGEFDGDLDMITDQRIQGFRGADFIGIDYYFRLRIRYNESADMGMEMLPCEDCTDFQWDIYPAGIRLVCRWIFEKYRLPLYILENGIADSTDSKRERYLKDHIRELWKSIELDGIPVKGYYHWSLIDNFEWAKGYGMRFGLYAVDYVTKQRTKRNSANAYEIICKTNEVDYES